MLKVINIMSIRISKNIDTNSIKHSNGLQSVEAIIENIASAINDPVKHKCQKIHRYMQSFLLDLIRSISSFEFFIQPLTNLELKLRIWEFIKLQISILVEINIQNLVLLHQIYTDDTTPYLLV